MTEHRNTVELIGTYGSDYTHCLSAWTSTKRELTEEREGRMGALLKMLAENEHHTPFEKSMLHFLVRSDIATHIHILKHRIGVSANAESARYRELREDRFYIPQDWPEELKDDFDYEVRRSFERYHSYVVSLEELGYSRSRAKESARFILPYATQILTDLSFNFRSFMLFQKLRNDDHAQLEIRQIAQEMLRLVQETGEFDLSLKAFGYA